MKISVSELIHHPLNQLVYKLSGIDELVENIKSVGLLQPLTIDQHNQVISGNRRFESIKRLGWSKVEVNKMNVKEGDETLLLIHFNQQRVKSVVELLGEYDYLKNYYKENKHKLNLKGKSVRDVISDDIKITDGQLARLLFIRKNNPEFVELIDKGIMTVNQGYLQSQRSSKEKHSINHQVDSINEVSNNDAFKFYQKSSDNMCELDDNSVQTIFSSPPYWNKILYSNDGGLGNEKTSNEFVHNLIEHLKDCYRVLNDKGSFFLNLGDTFDNGNLQNIPHKVVIGLQEQGWVLRNTIIWSKTNPKPSSTKTNLTPSYEFIFHLIKSMDYSYQLTPSPLSELTKSSLPPRHRSTNGKNSSVISPYIPNINGKNMGDFWSEDVIKSSVSNQKKMMGIEHPATFPEQIVYLPLLQTSVYPFMDNPNLSPLVLDPFAGSLTTNRVVEKINKEYGTKLRFVGYDVNIYF